MLYLRKKELQTQNDIEQQLATSGQLWGPRVDEDQSQPREDSEHVFASQRLLGRICLLTQGAPSQKSTCYFARLQFDTF